MTVEELIADLRAEFKRLDEADQIQVASVYRWVEVALKRFGGTIATDTEAIIRSKNGQARLPDGFYDLIYGYRCEPWYYECDEKMKPELQQEIGFVERTERETRWCSCNECCKEEHCNVITEKLYINTPKEVKFHYRHPILLNQKRRMNKDSCTDGCNSKLFKDCPNDIVINGPIMYCGFDGPIYIKYRGLPFHDDELVIPDTPLGLVARYVETYVKMRLFEVVAFSGEVPNAGDMYKVYAQKEPFEFRDAMADAKMQNFSLKNMGETLKRGNRRKMEIYENIYPQNVEMIKVV